jgi:hypothetical protein
LILGVSHMTLACDDIDAGLGHLAGLGYRPEFIERDLPSPRAKASLLSAPFASHAIAYTRAAHGLPIELISYGGAPPPPAGRFVGIFDEPGAVVSPAATAAPIPGRPSLAAATLPGFEPPMLATRSRKKGGLVGAVVTVADMARARRFWCEGFGLREVGTWYGGINLEFASPVPAWRFSISLVQGKGETPQPFLDSLGMACLSFVSSSLERDAAQLRQCGATHATCPLAMTVNGKALSVEILRGPDGEFVELLQRESVNANAARGAPAR